MSQTLTLVQVVLNSLKGGANTSLTDTIDELKRQLKTEVYQMEENKKTKRSRATAAQVSGRRLLPRQSLKVQRKKSETEEEIQKKEKKQNYINKKLERKVLQFVRRIKEPVYNSLSLYKKFLIRLKNNDRFVEHYVGETNTYANEFIESIIIDAIGNPRLRSWLKETSPIERSRRRGKLKERASDDEDYDYLGDDEDSDEDDSDDDSNLGGGSSRGVNILQMLINTIVKYEREYHNALKSMNMIQLPILRRNKEIEKITSEIIIVTEGHLNTFLDQLDHEESKSMLEELSHFVDKMYDLYVVDRMVELRAPTGAEKVLDELEKAYKHDGKEINKILHKIKTRYYWLMSKDCDKYPEHSTRREQCAKFQHIIHQDEKGPEEY